MFEKCSQLIPSSLVPIGLTASTGGLAESERTELENKRPVCAISSYCVLVDQMNKRGERAIEAYVMGDENRKVRNSLFQMARLIGIPMDLFEKMKTKRSSFCYLIRL
jgi:hypothetical protein